MGARVIRTGNIRRRQSRDTRTILFIIAAIAGPCVLVFFLIAQDIRIDLSDLKPRYDTVENGAVLLGWPSLSRSEDHNVPLPRGRCRMIGYMMQNVPAVPDGTPVNRFVLMPEAGQLLHPAHRIPDEMIEVWLAEGTTIPFHDRLLVWVDGVLRENVSYSTGPSAAYAFSRATVTSAVERDVSKWFTP